MLKSDEITALLRRGATLAPEAPGEQNETLASAVTAAQGEASSSVAAAEPTSIRNTCDVGYVLFLEPSETDDPKWTTAELVVDRLIRWFSPTPTMMHTELIVPPIPDSGGGKVHFATYLGAAGANWQNQSDARPDGIDFYLVANGHRWRCIPVFAPAVADTLRQACDDNLHAEYSLGMYPTSAKPLRNVAWLWGDSAGHKGHCATLTARVLKEAGAGYALSECSAYYSPATLYTALSSSLSNRLDERERENLQTVEPEACQQTIETLLRGKLAYKTVRGLGDGKCIDAIRALTMRVVATSDTAEQNPVAARTAQKELATALLRWVLLRADGQDPYSHEATDII